MRIVSASLLAALAVSVSACATVGKTQGADGRAQYSIGCGGVDDWGQCYTEAEDLCGTKDYEVISRKGDPNQGSVFNIFASRRLVVACQQPYTPATSG